MSDIEASLRLNIAQYQEQLAKAQGETNKVMGQMRRASRSWSSQMAKQGEEAGLGLSRAMEKGVSSYGDNLKKVVTGVIAGAAFAGIRGAAAAINAANAQESLRVRMNVLVGDEQGANDLLSQLRSLGSRTPLEFQDLAEAGQMLVAFGEKAADVPDTLQRIGDVSTGVGARIQEIAEIYGKARVQGTLYAEDINQLTGRGIPVIQEFSRILGVQESQVKKLASEGKLTFPALQQAFINLTSEGGKFNGMMEEVSKTGDGLWSTFKDEISAVQTEFGKPLAAAWNASLRETIPLLTGLKDTMRVISGDSSVFAEGRTQAVENMKNYRESKSKEAMAATERVNAMGSGVGYKPAASTEANQPLSEEQQKAKEKAAADAAAGRQKDLKHVTELRSRLAEMSRSMLPEDQQLAALQSRLSEIFVSAQMGAGKGMTATIDGLRKLADQQRTEGNPVMESATLERLREALEIEKQMQSIQKSLREEAARSAEEKAAAAQARRDKDIAKTMDIARDNEQSGQKVRDQTEALAVFKAEMAIIDAQAAGQTKKAEAMQRALNIAQLAKQLQDQMNVSEAEALRLATQRVDAEKKAGEMKGGGASRYDANGMRADGRHQIKGYSQAQGDAGTQQLEAGAARQAAYAKSEAARAAAFGGLDKYNQMQKTPLRDTFQTPALDAYNQMQKDPLSGKAQQNAAVQDRKAPGNGGVDATTQQGLQIMQQMLSALTGS